MHERRSSERDDLPRSHPEARAFRDAVRDEDPVAWPHAPSRGGSYTADRAPPRDTATTPRTTTTGAGAASARPAPAHEETRVIGRADAPAWREAVEPPVGRRRFSLGATFLGWAVATFFTFIAFTIVAGALGIAGGQEAVAGGLESGEIANVATLAGIGALVATFVAFLIGGYAAGRIALWDGVPHGLGIVAWTVLFALVGFAVGTFYGADIVALTGFELDLAGLTGPTIVGLVLTLVAMLAGAALGGRIGERYHERVHGLDPRRSSERRGRSV